MDKRDEEFNSSTYWSNKNLRVASWYLGKKTGNLEKEVGEKLNKKDLEG